MRWSLASLLSSACVVLVANASPLVDHAVHDVHSDNLAHDLLRRVRTGSGDDSSSGGGAEDLFLIEDGDGSCSSKVTTIDEWLAEARLLHSAVETAYANAVGTPPLVILWVTFFGVQFDYSTMTLKTDTYNKEIWANIGDHISRVSQFLSGAGFVNPQNSNENPRLFCSADAFEHQDWGLPVKDKNAEDVVATRDDETGLPLTYVKLSDTFMIQKSQGANAFWVSAFNGYDFSFTGYTSMCPKKDAEGRIRYARTARPASAFPAVNDGVSFEFGKGNRHIVLCPPAFSPEGGHSYESLAKAVSEDGYPTAGSEDESIGLDRMLTVSATLYHELYHLTDDDNTNDWSYSLKYIIETLRDAADNVAQAEKFGDDEDVDEAKDALQVARRANSHNPETYALFAMSSYLYLNPPEGEVRALYLGTLPVPASAWGHQD